MRKVSLILMIFLLLLVGAVSAQGEPATTADVIPDILYVRGGPGTNYSIIGEFPAFTRLNVYGRNDAVTWVYVSNGSVTGWVNAAYLRFPEGFNVAGEVPIFPDNVAGVPAGDTATGGSAGGNTGSNTGVQPRPDVGPDGIYVAPEDGGTAVTTPQQTGGAASVVTGPSNGTVKTAANFRRGPGLQFGIISLLTVNTPVNAIGRNAAGTWIKVQAVGTEGWVFADLLTLNVTRSSLPVVDGSTPATTTTTTPNTTQSNTAPSTTTQSTGNYSNVMVGVGPGGSPDRDGRLNPFTYLGYAIFYCVNAQGYTDRGTFNGGGIVIYNYDGPSKGVIFFASEAEINAVGVPAEGVQPVKSEAGYTLYRRYDGLFEMRGVNLNNEPFIFRWKDCNPGPVLGVQ